MMMRPIFAAFAGWAPLPFAVTSFALCPSKGIGALRAA